MEESVTYQAILEEGMEKGIVKGMGQGALVEAKKLLLLQGETRFGSPDASMAARLAGVNDLSRLEALSVQLLQANSWKELLGRTGPRRSSTRRRRKS